MKHSVELSTSYLTGDKTSSYVQPQYLHINMASSTPQWLETIGEKRRLRDNAISSFLGVQSGSIEVTS
jgi:hypothetical protein